MIASVHVADVGPVATLRAMRSSPDPATVDGLRHAEVALTAVLGGSALPVASLRRVGLVAFWDDDGALDGFLAGGHPLASALDGGWHVRLAPLRAFGSWPGLPTDLPAARAVEHEGPVAALTLGRLRLTQAVRFFRTSARAERRAVTAPGLIWATALARPPFVATCSLWESTRALSTYAYGRAEPDHPDAIASGDARPFHHRQAFVRFRPYGSRGGLAGRNPLSDTWLAEV